MRPKGLEANLLGGEKPRAKLYRDIKAMDIVEGTGQIQRIIMARKLVDLPR